MLPLLVMLEGDVSNVARQRVARAAMQTMPSFPHHKTPDSHTHTHRERDAHWVSRFKAASLRAAGRDMLALATG